MKKLIDWASILLVVLTVLWACVPSSIFLRNISLTVHGDVVQYVRETPFGSVDARWRAEIVLIDGENMECNSGAWKTATYQKKAGNSVTYRLGDWARDCLDAGPPFYLTTTRQVLLAGIIPLRQQVQTTEVEGDRVSPLIFIVPGEQ